MRIRNRPLSTSCLVLMALALFGCSLGCARRVIRVETHTDDDGTMVTRMIGNEIALNTPGARRDKAWFDAWCGLDAQRCQDAKGRVAYHLLLTVRSRDGGTMGRYLDVSAPVSLSLVIDGQAVRLSPEKDHSNRYGTDTWSYPLSVSTLRNLAEAHEIDVTLSNEGGTLAGWCRSERFKEFLDQCGDPADSPVAPGQ